MIRINLLPEAKRKEVGVRGSSQIWLVVYLVAAAAWGVLLLMFYWHFEGKLEEKEAANAELQQEIARAEKQNANLEEIQQKLDKSKRLEQVVTQLQKARSGPTRMLTELSNLISKDSGPTVDPQVLEDIRREQPLAGYNPSWDFRRLWISSFVEKDRRCSIAGVGKTNEDVAEFLRRLMLSEVFTDVYLQQTSSGVEKATGLPTVSFSISCKVRY